ncbi:aldo-keto reductase, putative [Stipitochalara longipes BDJ]|nr:aldo-keto reductase, putative [Stipitochalara longipes BDJ]
MAKFPQRKIGDALVSAIGLGCMGMSIPPFNDSESLAVLTAAADLGLNFWVTSSGYGPNETLLGRWFRANPSRRSEIFLATKFGRVIVDGKMLHPGTADYVKKSCEKSLETLGVEYIDLYSQHRVDPETPIEETVQAMKELVEEGKVRYLGLSECSARSLRRANKVHPIAAIEMEFSPFALEIEDPAIGVLEAARECGTSIVAYAPLGKGFLTGTIKSRDDFPEGDTRKTMFPRFSEENFQGNLTLVEELTKLAEEKGVKTSQLVIAWILAQGNDFIPLPGTKHVKYLVENAEAINIVLSKQDDERIRNVIESVGGTKGARYPEASLSSLFGNSPELK